VKIKITTDGLRESQWYEYVVRFVFGGTVTALTGIIAKRFGPEIGGLFLAFPAILPATATLIEKHEKRKKAEAGINGTARGRAVTGVDAAGAAIGSIGLGIFAVVVWQGLPKATVGVVLTIATLAWLVTSVGVWQLRESLGRRLRAHRSHASGRTLSTSVHTTRSTKKEIR
jgi:hypothetical protein